MTLIVRLKLLGEDNSFAEFSDISIPFNLNNAGSGAGASAGAGASTGADTDIDTSMYDDASIYADTNINTYTNNNNNNKSELEAETEHINHEHINHEHFVITSQPAPIKFNNNNNNYNELLKTKLGENQVDYPTIQYSSNNNIFDDNYFSMISGNNKVNKNNIIEKFGMRY